MILVDGDVKTAADTLVSLELECRPVVLVHELLDGLLEVVEDTHVGALYLTVVDDHPCLQLLGRSGERGEVKSEKKWQNSLPPLVTYPSVSSSHVLSVELSLAQTDPCEHLLRVIREVAGENPTVIARIDMQDVGHGDTLVLAEVEYLCEARVTIGIE